MAEKQNNVTTQHMNELYRQIGKTCLQFKMFRMNINMVHTEIISFPLVYHQLNPFPHMTILQQTTLNIFCQKVENL